MAFNFWGTFTQGQYEAFKTFSLVQKTDIDNRRKWLETEIRRVGIFSTDYDDNNNPISFSCSPAISYGAKLLEAYRILGGIPEQDFLLRTIDKPVFLTEGAPITFDDNGTVSGGTSEEFSDGRRYRGSIRFDRDMGLKVNRLRSWQLEQIKFKREHLEFKIKRCLDYSDQIAAEIVQLKTLAGDGLKSVDDLIITIDQAISDPTQINVPQGSSNDKYGLKIGAIGSLDRDGAIETGKAEDQRGV
jgi:hypothetical protein